MFEQLKQYHLANLLIHLTFIRKPAANKMVFYSLIIVIISASEEVRT